MHSPLHVNPQQRQLPADVLRACMRTAGIAVAAAAKADTIYVPKYAGPQVALANRDCMCAAAACIVPR